jgi:hypothetical protein
MEYLGVEAVKDLEAAVLSADVRVKRPDAIFLVREKAPMLSLGHPGRRIDETKDPRS